MYVVCTCFSFSHLFKVAEPSSGASQPSSCSDDIYDDIDDNISDLNDKVSTPVECSLTKVYGLTSFPAIDVYYVCACIKTKHSHAGIYTWTLLKQQLT